MRRPTPDLEVAQKVCGARNPVRGSTCVAQSRYHHVHHRDADGRQWPNSPAGSDQRMTIDEARAELEFWGDPRMPWETRDRAFSDLIGWVAMRAVAMDEPGAADLLRRIRDRAERS